MTRHHDYPGRLQGKVTICSHHFIIDCEHVQTRDISKLVNFDLYKKYNN